MTGLGLTRIAMAGVLCASLGMGQALAAGASDDAPSAPKDTNYTKAVKLIKAKNYKSAIPLLKKAAAKNPKNADVQNYLGYTHRKTKKFKMALKYYQAALKIEPKHRGANEYLGELYLQTGQLAKAEERLKVLDGACFFGCEEYTDLKKAIAKYKARKGKSS